MLQKYLKSLSNKRLFATTFAVLVLSAVAIVPGSNAAAPLQSGSRVNERDLSNIAAASSIADEVPMAPAEAPPERTPQSKQTTDRSTDQGFASEDFLYPDSKKVTPRQSVIPENPTVTVVMAVPQMADATDRFIAYPYANPIPKRRGPPYANMPATRDAIRNLLQTEYTGRNTESRFYPTGGFRWKMAYKNALRQSGVHEPSFITTLYPFINKMEPYMVEECKKFDKMEEERKKRVERATEEYELNRASAENEATRKGYFPIEFRFVIGTRTRGPRSAAQLKLPDGTWYITGTHKVPGLTYYWQEPVHVSQADPQTVLLTVENALLIEGGW